MSSVYFRIEVYGYRNYGCPELDLMGYNDFDELERDCWEESCKKDSQKTRKVKE